ncbi:cadherin domain-containing protein [Microvirga antarctica]|uniref:cadherin domain-containing protein n=1 Tax=Microvirga antarctica TaxID=2819233 RepID=UPI001B30AA58|nr:cadherin domain-containing protein [Microvirga antarctica]
MTTDYVIGSTNSIVVTANNAVGLNLAAGDSLTVQQGGSITSSGTLGFGVDSSTGRHIVSIDGIISAPAFGRALALNGSMMVSIGETGSVSGERGGLEIYGSATVYNSGHISGLTALAYRTDEATQSLSLINQGTMTGNVVLQGRSVISNFGTIDGMLSSIDSAVVYNGEHGILTGKATLSDFADTFVGGAGSETIDPGAGNDLIDGGDGSDTLLVSSGSPSIAIDLASNAAQNFASWGTKTLLNIENLTVTGHARAALHGNDLRNILTGDSENDTLDGGGGDDLLTGKDGSDVLIGGGGNDTAAYTSNSAAYTIQKLADHHFTVTYSAPESAEVGADDLTDIRFAQFTDKTVTLYNAAPDSVALSTTSVSESKQVGQSVALLSSHDADGDAVTYTLSDNGNGTFDIFDGAIRLAKALNAATTPQYTITVKAKDAYGGETLKSFTIDVTSGAATGHAPSAIGLSGAIVAENAGINTPIGLLSAQDADADETFTYALLDNAGGRFSLLTTASGTKLVVADGTKLDYETAASHQVKVRVTDSGGNTFDQTFTIAVTDLADNNHAPVAIGLTAASIAEGSANAVPVGQLLALDVDQGETFTYALVDSAGGRFALNGAQLVVADGTKLDYETATAHQIKVQVTDHAGASFQQTLTIAVTDVAEGGVAPNAIGLSGAVVAESAAINTPIGLLSAQDADAGETFTYTLLDNAGGRFALSSDATGTKLVVADGTKLDYETAASHQIKVRVTDKGGHTFDQTFTIAVTDLADNNHKPVAVGLTAAIVAEGAASETPVGTLLAQDVDANDTFTYTLVDDAGGRFMLKGTQLVVADGTKIDYEQATSHHVTVRVTDGGGLSLDQVLTIAVSDVAETNHAPTAITLSAETTAENAVKDSLIGRLSTQDVDVNETFTYALLDDAGGRFALASDSSGTKLVVADGTKLDYETARAHDVKVRVTDSAGHSIERTFTVAVTDVAEGTGGTGTTPTPRALVLVGTSAVDRLTGDSLDDSLTGLAGNDVLSGLAGNDKLSGGLGRDVLSGGAGRDMFVFDTKPNARTNLDRVVDFSVPDDTIALAKSVFKGLAKKGGLSKAAFWSGPAAHDDSDRIIYNKKTGALFYDHDGKGHDAAVQIATLSKGLKMAAGDFLVI